ncbi:hypothetical protein SAMN05216369_1315 [Marinobacter antarcticus]|uniref:Uncharacterized protein n=1 Tax=Marinobacter antarcticus TaxID=564117 RepID=A0A1M6R555_9GAMM|nr:hypothetical protein SAMN05216369_1315 [Marinobacter antarcticus]
MKRHATIVKPGDYESALSVVGTDVIVLAAKQVTQGQEFTFQRGKKAWGLPRTVMIGAKRFSSSREALISPARASRKSVPLLHYGRLNCMARISATE